MRTPGFCHALHNLSSEQSTSQTGHVPAGQTFPGQSPHGEDKFRLIGYAPAVRLHVPNHDWHQFRGNTQFLNAFPLYQFTANDLLTNMPGNLLGQTVLSPCSCILFYLVFIRCNQKIWINPVDKSWLLRAFLLDFNYKKYDIVRQFSSR